MKAKDFDKKFDEGKEDITHHLKLETMKRLDRGQKRINLNFPSWMLHSIDNESKRLGITRQSLIKIWIADRLKNREA